MRISYDKAQEIADQPGWESICDNNSGTAYWNAKTGELLWISDNDECNISKPRMLNILKKQEQELIELRAHKKWSNGDRAYQNFLDAKAKKR